MNFFNCSNWVVLSPKLVKFPSASFWSKLNKGNKSVPFDKFLALLAFTNPTIKGTAAAE